MSEQAAEVLEEDFVAFFERHSALLVKKEKAALLRGKRILCGLNGPGGKITISCFLSTMFFALYSPEQAPEKIKEELVPFFAFFARPDLPENERIEVLREASGLLLLAIEKDNLNILDSFIDCISDRIPFFGYYKTVIRYMREYWRPEKRGDKKTKNLRMIEDGIPGFEKGQILDYISFVKVVNGL
jgi:hypothetical protein